MEEAAPFILFAFIFGVVPMVFMLLKHQQKMAELLHRQSEQPQHDPLLLQELARLRDVVAQQSIAIDNLAASQRKLEASNELERRLIEH